MNIDNNDLEKQALACFRCGATQKGHQLQNEFLKQVHASGQDPCPCTVPCPHHAHCQDCVLLHRGHQDHLPNCFHPMVNQRLNALTSLTESTLQQPD